MDSQVHFKSQYTNLRPEGKLSKQRTEPTYIFAHTKTYTKLSKFSWELNWRTVIKLIITCNKVVSSAISILNKVILQSLGICTTAITGSGINKVKLKTNLVCGSTDIHVLDFWWCLLWVSKPMCSLICTWQRHMVQHLLTFWQPAWQPNQSFPCTCKQALVGLETGIYRAADERTRIKI